MPFAIQPIKVDKFGHAVANCDDTNADTFLILTPIGIEVMRASTRALANDWLQATPCRDATNQVGLYGECCKCGVDQGERGCCS